MRRSSSIACKEDVKAASEYISTCNQNDTQHKPVGRLTVCLYCNCVCSKPRQTTHISLAWARTCNKSYCMSFNLREISSPTHRYGMQVTLFRKCNLRRVTGSTDFEHFTEDLRDLLVLRRCRIHQPPPPALSSTKASSDGPARGRLKVLAPAASKAYHEPPTRFH